MKWTSSQKYKLWKLKKVWNIWNLHGRERVEEYGGWGRRPSVDTMKTKESFDKGRTASWLTHFFPKSKQLRTKRDISHLQKVKLNFCPQFWNPVLLDPPRWNPGLGKTPQPHQTMKQYQAARSALGRWLRTSSIFSLHGRNRTPMARDQGRKPAKMFVSQDSSNATVKRIDKAPGHMQELTDNL